MGVCVPTATVVAGAGDVSRESVEWEFPRAGATSRDTDDGHAEKARSHFPELDCLRPFLSAAVLVEAEDRATRLGVGADRVLIASGALDEETYLRRLGDALGIKYESLSDVPRARCPFTDDRLIESAITGLLRLTRDGETYLVIAPRETTARQITVAVRRHPSLARRLRLTSSDHLKNFVLRCAGKTLTSDAIHELNRRWPEMSAGPPRRIKRFVVAAAIAGLPLLATIALAPWSTLNALAFMFSGFFLCWVALRLIGTWITRYDRAAPLLDLPDASLPIYSVILALRGEAAVVDKLLTAIERLDYPAEKLDVILAIEANDPTTRAAIEARKHRIPITVIPCPYAIPQTKPKALNVALRFARGAFTVVYDAEDRPEPDQLRRALQAFHTADDKLICVQARLCIDNTRDGWLTRFFTAEYAGHFDVFLGGLARMRLPLPLGGSSNHFRTDKLREIGAWDPYNVTEDADLGMRLARFGYRSDVIFSTTIEEAPARFTAWLKQRTRWFKGWMQTWAVHMRHPLRLKRELGLAGFMTFQLIVGGNAFAALAHLAYLLFMTILVGAIALGFADWRSHSAAVFAALVGTIAGYGISAYIGWLGLARRKLTSIARVLTLTPVHWILLSLAAWRALYQFVFDPYSWEKTEHGVAKSSRLAETRTQSLLALEHHLRAMKAAGNLPALSNDAKRSSLERGAFDISRMRRFR